MLDTEKLQELQVGMEFKNFKELAGWFGIGYSPTATNSIKAIKKEFERYFSWEKIKGCRGVRITSIHSIVRAKKTAYAGCDTKNSLIATGLLRANSNRRYSKIAETARHEEANTFIAAMQSSKHRMEKVVITRKELFNELDVHIDSSISDDIIEVLDDYKSISVTTIKSTSKQELQNKLHDILTGAFKSLRNKYLLEFYSGDSILYEGRWVFSTKEQQRLLNEAKATALKRLKLRNSNQAYLNSMYKEYVKWTIKSLPEGSYIADFKASYLIVFTPEQLREYIIEHLGNVPTVEDAKTLLFNVITTTLYEVNCKHYMSATEEELFKTQAVAPELKEYCYNDMLR